MQEIYAEPIKPELIGARIAEIRAAGVVAAGALSPQNTQAYAKHVVDSGVDFFVIRGTTVSAEHVSRDDRAAQPQAVHLRPRRARDRRRLRDLPGRAAPDADRRGRRPRRLRRGSGRHDALGARRRRADGLGHLRRRRRAPRLPRRVRRALRPRHRRRLGGPLRRHRQGDRLRRRRGHGRLAAGQGRSRPRAAASTGARGLARDPAARRARALRDGRHARADPARPLDRARRHHEPRRRAPQGDGHHGLLRRQGVPARRGRARPSPGHVRGHRRRP